MDTTQLIGITAGILTSVSMLPQLIKLFRERKAKDVSLLMLVVLIAGVGMWLWYGFLKKDSPIIYANSFSLLVNISTLVMSLKYKDR